MCRCEDCDLMADNEEIDVEMEYDGILFEWSDADDSKTWELPPCYGSHKLQDLLGEDSPPLVGGEESPF